jgi:hypothetical protein
MQLTTRLVLGVLAAITTVATASADIFTGTVYFTRFSGAPNVGSVTYSYNSTTQVLTTGAPNLFATTQGADGIIFDANGNLLVGGQGFNHVTQFNPATPGTQTTASSVGASFHLALDPSGTKVYTSNFEGPLEILPLTPTIQNGTSHNVTGGDTGLTQIAFAPTTGNVFYVDGNPNSFGNLGTINLTTFVTTRFATGVQPAHGLIYDSFTGLMTIFGGGETGTFDQSGGNLKTSTQIYGVGDFDQGAVDGSGHAFVAGSNELTFIDYSSSHDITHPDKVINLSNVDYINIDDLAPLSGLGSSSTPEPASIVLLFSIAAGLALKFKNRLA